MEYDRRFGLAYVAGRFHSGQWSRGYALLSKLDVRWGTDNASRLLPREEWAGARDQAAKWTRYARANKGAF